MGYAGGGSIKDGLNVKANHDAIVKNFEQTIPRAAAMNVPNVITFFGNTRGMSDEEAIGELRRRPQSREEDRRGPRRDDLRGAAEQQGRITPTTRAIGRRSAWRSSRRSDSPRVKLLYDIYHMQIMEGDLIRTIRDQHQYIGHYHTGGVPGRHELDETQEVNWRGRVPRDRRHRLSRDTWRTSSCRRAIRSRLCERR